MWGGEPVLHTGCELHGHLHRTATTVQSSQQRVWRPEADVMPPRIGLQSEGISDFNLTGICGEVRPEYQGLAYVAPRRFEALLRVK